MFNVLSIYSGFLKDGDYVRPKTCFYMMPPVLQDDEDYHEWTWHGEKINGLALPFKNLPAHERTKAREQWNDEYDHGEDWKTEIEGHHIYKVTLFQSGKVAHLVRTSKTDCLSRVTVPRGWLTQNNVEIVACHTLADAQELEQQLRESSGQSDW